MRYHKGSDKIRIIFHFLSTNDTHILIKSLKKKKRHEALQGYTLMSFCNQRQVDSGLINLELQIKD